MRYKFKREVYQSRTARRVEWKVKETAFYPCGSTLLFYKWQDERISPLHASNPVLTDINFCRMKRRYGNTVKLWFTQLYNDVWNNILNLLYQKFLLIILVLILFYKYIILNFYNPTLRWKIRRFISPKVRCSTRKSKKNDSMNSIIKSNPYSQQPEPLKRT